ncbi:MAG: class I SAM-dependent methyltransferase [Hyphomicrobiaceae bacterium]|nr:class I SAM-dependent methyltransferase [Hyphomicrobiaceae bacterium]
MNPSAKATQAEIDARNAAFWDELCGSQLARQLGVTDNSPESLKKFDDWYFDFYPYLYRHIPFAEMADKAVLEIGLGYGTVAQKIAESGALYHGLDIAQGPVAMAAHRCTQIGAESVDVRQGSILEPPFEKESFDWVVAIGCLHHTGNLGNAIESVHGLLKPGGQAMIMVYNAASYRQFAVAPFATLKRKATSPFVDYTSSASNEKERGAYDVNVEGEAAPQTEFVTKSELRKLCDGFASVRIHSENIGAEGPLKLIPRRTLCTTLGPIVGLDLYCRLAK